MKDPLSPMGKKVGPLLDGTCSSMPDQIGIFSTATAHVTLVLISFCDTTEHIVLGSMGPIASKLMQGPKVLH